MGGGSFLMQRDRPRACADKAALRARAPVATACGAQATLKWQQFARLGLPSVEIVSVTLGLDYARFLLVLKSHTHRINSCFTKLTNG